MILVSREKIDAATAQGWWGERTLWQVFSRWADERGTAEAVVDAPNRSEFANGTPQRWSWERLRTEADRLAAALLDVGLQRDDVLVAYSTRWRTRFHADGGQCSSVMADTVAR